MRLHKLTYLFMICLFLLLGCQIKTETSTQVIEIPEKIIKPTLRIWSYTDEIIPELEQFEHENSCEIEFELMDINGFETMVEARIKDGEKPDIIISDYETLMADALEQYIKPLNTFSSTYEVDKYLNQDMLKKSYDSKGNIRGLSYHMTPIAVFYRRSLAREILGTDAPEEIAKYFTTTQSIYDLALQLDQSGIGIFPDPYAFRHFAPLTDESTQWRDYFKLLNNIKHQKITPFYVEWSQEWFQGMEENIFSYVLPNWALSQVMILSAEETSGDWGIVSGPYTRQWGGTWLALTQTGQEQVLAEKFLEFILLDQEHQKNWLGNSYHLSSHKQVQKVQNYKLGNTFLGGQDYQQTFMKILDDGIDSRPEDQRNEAIIISFINDEFHTIDEALDMLENIE